MSSIAFDGVAVSYGKREVVAPFTEQVQSGEWLGLIGPNGAGKSSLLRAAVGLGAGPPPIFLTLNIRS